MTDGRSHDAAAYRERVEAALAGGWRFAGLHAARDGALVRTLLVGRDGSTRLETLATPGRAAVSIVDIAPAAGWDEREAHDLYAVSFAGHEPLRPLVDHSTGHLRAGRFRSRDTTRTRSRSARSTRA